MMPLGSLNLRSKFSFSLSFADRNTVHRWCGLLRVIFRNRSSLQQTGSRVALAQRWRRGVNRFGFALRLTHSPHLLCHHLVGS
jgi:hypothetical protein